MVDNELQSLRISRTDSVGSACKKLHLCVILEPKYSVVLNAYSGLFLDAFHKRIQPESLRLSTYKSHLRDSSAF